MLIAGPDRPERRATRLVFLLCGMAQSTWAPLVPYAKARVHANDQQFGLLLLCFGVGSILSMPTMGSLASRHGCKRLTQIAACSLTDCTLTLEFCYEAVWLLKRNTSEPCRILRLLGQLITTRQFSCWARTTKPEPFCEKLLRREGTRRRYLEK
jgi:hypothetical protein